MKFLFVFVLAISIIFFICQGITSHNLPNNNAYNVTNDIPASETMKESTQNLNQNEELKYNKFFYTLDLNHVQPINSKKANDLEALQKSIYKNNEKNAYSNVLGNMKPTFIVNALPIEYTKEYETYNKSFNNQNKTVFTNHIAFDVDDINLDHTNIGKLTNGTIGIKFAENNQNDLFENNSFSDFEFILTDIKYAETTYFGSKDINNTFLNLSLRKANPEDEEKNQRLYDYILFNIQDEVQLETILKLLRENMFSVLKLKILKDKFEVRKAFQYKPCTNFSIFEPEKFILKNLNDFLNDDQINKIFLNSCFETNKDSVKSNNYMVTDPDAVDKNAFLYSKFRIQISFFDGSDSISESAVLSIPKNKETEEFLVYAKNLNRSYKTSVFEIFKFIQDNHIAGAQLIIDKKNYFSLDASNNNNAQIEIGIEKFINKLECENFYKKTFNDIDLENVDCLYSNNYDNKNDKIKVMKFFLSSLKTNALFSYENYLYWIENLNNNSSSSFLNDLIILLDKDELPNVINDIKVEKDEDNNLNTINEGENILHDKNDQELSDDQNKKTTLNAKDPLKEQKEDTNKDNYWGSKTLYYAKSILNILFFID
ncbi:hypothetical protein GVAV_002722 [Gurleya vavrai]